MRAPKWEFLTILEKEGEMAVSNPHAQRGLLCVSVKSHLNSGVSVHPENTVTYMYLAGNGG